MMIGEIIKARITPSRLFSIIGWVLCTVSVFLIIFSAWRWEMGKNGEGYRLITEGTVVTDIEVYTEEMITVVIPDGITVVGEKAFFNVENLKTVIFPDTIVLIEEFAFSECFGIEKLTFPDSLCYIAPCAFYRCEELSQIEPREGRTYNGTEYGADEQDMLVKLITSRNSDIGITVRLLKKP